MVLLTNIVLQAAQASKSTMLWAALLHLSITSRARQDNQPKDCESHVSHDTQQGHNVDLQLPCVPTPQNQKRPTGTSVNVNVFVAASQRSTVLVPTDP